MTQILKQLVPARNQLRQRILLEVFDAIATTEYLPFGFLHIAWIDLLRVAGREFLWELLASPQDKGAGLPHHRRPQVRQLQDYKWLNDPLHP